MTRKQQLALLATIIGSAIVFLDGSVVNLALPKIAQNLHANFADLQWVVDGYLLSLSALILLGGSLGDIFGRKRIYLTGLYGFGTTSLFCGLAPSIALLIYIRCVQGIFAALLVPGALAIINTNFPKNMRGLAIGRWTAWSALANVAGPLVGGSILDLLSWRWIFLINVPLIVVCVLLAYPGILETRDEKPRNIDIGGALLVMIGLGGMAAGLIEGPSRRWDLVTLLLLVIGMLSFAFFILLEFHKRDPMVQMSLFKSRNFSGANISTFAMYGALSGFFFSLVIYLQTKVGFSSLAAGASLLPVTILLISLSALAGRLSTRYGPRLFMTLGPLLGALGIAMLYGLHSGSTYLAGVLPGILLFGLGMALTVAPLTTTVMTSVQEADSGIASGINNAVARVSGLIIIALLGLFGTAQSYRLAVLLCTFLAAGAGALSYIFIRNDTTSIV